MEYFKTQIFFSKTFWNFFDTFYVKERLNWHTIAQPLEYLTARACHMMNLDAIAKKTFTLWFTGLPCSGKTILSETLSKEFQVAGFRSNQVDGDVLRKGISQDLGYSKEDRCIQVYRATGLASYFNQTGSIALVSLVSPYRDHRAYARKQIPNFIEVYVRCPLNVCESRDTKGLYRLARTGKIEHFTGVSDPYEEPENCEIVVDTDRMDARCCVDKMMDFLIRKNYLSNPDRKNIFSAYEFNQIR